MIRFEAFEALGPALAAMSDLEDGDCAGRVDRSRFLSRLGLEPGQINLLWQCHSDIVVEVPAAGFGGTPPRGDALVARAPGVLLGMAVADCVPVFLYGANPATIALVHAGREGTRRKIVAAAVRGMAAGRGPRPGNIHALIGPSAGPCCYEVSPEIAAEWAAAGLPAAGRHLDLWEANRRQLVAAGVPPAQVGVFGHCTICGGRFHSYRAGRTAARNLAVLML